MSWASSCLPHLTPCAHLLHQVDKAASGLLSIGLCKGDRLGMWGPNSYAWVLIQLATAQAGIILVRRGLLDSWVCVGEHHSRGAPQALSPQDQTSAWLVSNQVALSPEAHQGGLQELGGVECCLYASWGQRGSRRDRVCPEY